MFNYKRAIGVNLAALFCAHLNIQVTDLFDPIV